MKDPRYKLLAIIFVIALLFSLFTLYVTAEGAPSISAKAAVLYDPDGKSFLYEKQSNLRLPMASTTKIMTALVTIESCNLQEEVTVDSRAVGTEGSSIYLKADEIMTIEDLLYALMLRSANDAAEAIAYHISGSIDDFAALMNSRARALGLTDTSFENPHGLDSKNHYTTAHDLAIIAGAAMSNPKFAEIVSTDKREIKSSAETRVVKNHNKLLTNMEGCVGIKTGYTERSGRSLVSAADRDMRCLICVTLSAPDDWNDHKKLINYGFSKYNNGTALE